MTMWSRRIAAAVTAAFLVAGISGCGQGAARVPQGSARIAVNDNARTSHAVSCIQVKWLLTVDISAAPAKVRALLRLDPDKPKPQSVNIDNFNGFSGVADAGAGKAEATFSEDAYHITGTAQRTNAVNPEESGPADFTIDVTC